MQPSRDGRRLHPVGELLAELRRGHLADAVQYVGAVAVVAGVEFGGLSLGSILAVMGGIHGARVRLRSSEDFLCLYIYVVVKLTSGSRNFELILSLRSFVHSSFILFVNPNCLHPGGDHRFSSNGQIYFTCT